MLDFSKCSLYRLSSKKGLKYILHINDNKWFCQEFVSNYITPYIDHTKNRLIEAPDVQLKLIQRRIKNCLGMITVPDNVFSGIKKRSYIDNVNLHAKNSSRNLFKIDFSAFFPSISRDRVYSFFRKDLECSPDIAAILTNFTTIDLDYSKRSTTEIDAFLRSKGLIEHRNLLSGSPASQILSYLVNHEMFDEMQKIADHNHLTMSIYVDDVFFSSEHRISKATRESILRIIKKFHFHVSKNKVGRFHKGDYKKVTGVIIDSEGRTKPCNLIRKNIIEAFYKLKEDPSDEKTRLRLRGLLIAIRQVDSSAFPNIYSFAFKKP